MNLYYLIGYPLFLVSALEIYLGFILLRQNPRKSPVNKAVAAFSFFSAAFAFFSALMYLRAAAGLDYSFVTRATWIGWFSIPAALQFLFYMKDEKGRTARVVGSVLYAVWTIIFALCLSTDLVVPRYASLIPFQIERHGPLEYPARIFGAALIFWVMYEAYMIRRKATGIRRVQLNYFSLGTLIFGGGGALTAGFLQLSGGLGFDPSLASYFSLSWVLLTFFAIARYNLFDIRIIISRTLAITLFFIVFSVIQIAIFKLFEPSLGHEPAILISLSFMAFIFFGTGVRERVQDRIERFIVKDKYDYQHILKESIKAIVTILDLDELLKYIMVSIKKSMGIGNICLFLKRSDGAYALRYGEGAVAKRSGRLCLAPVLVNFVKQTGETVVRQKLEGTLPQQYARGITGGLEDIEADLVVPLSYQGKLLGLLTLGQKGTSEPYVQSDIDLLESLAGHAAVAIQNARLYDEAGRVKESLLKSEARFRNLVETTSDWVWEVDERGAFTYVSPKITDILGYAPEEVIGKRPYDLMTQEDARRSEDFLRTMAGERKTFRVFQHSNLDKNGNIVVIETSGVPIYDPAGKFIGYRGINRDVTERIKLEGSLRYAQKMEAVGRLATGVAHDFNNIITAIVGFATVLNMKMKEDDPLKQKVELILASTERAAKLTENLTDFGKKQELKFVPLVLDDIIKGMGTLLHELVRDKIRISTRFSDGKVTIMADGSQLERVMMNLVVNARDAMPDGGDLVIETGVTELDSGFVKAYGYGRVGAYGIISVKDTGAGMDDEVKVKIFEPCFTTKARGKGSGFGLAIVYGIVKEHGGYITVDSAPGKGSTFNVYLPVAPGSGTAP